jgi:hypothetical protein
MKLMLVIIPAATKTALPLLKPIQRRKKIRGAEIRPQFGTEEQFGV